MPIIVPPVVKKKKRPHKLEKAVEAYYKKEVAKIGGVSWKFTSPNRRSVTDQVTLLFGRVIFVEMKAWGKELSDKQAIFRDLVLAHGGEHATVAGCDGVDKIIAELKASLTWYQQVLIAYRLVVKRISTRYDHL